MSDLLPGDLHLWTSREGALAAVGHDLVLGVGQWQISRHGDQVEARVDSTTVRPLGARIAGEVSPARLSRRDLASIQESLHRAVLCTQTHPEAWWRGTATPTREGVRLDGVLHLCGQAHSLVLTGVPAGTRLRVTGTVVPSRWGIRPFRALLGTLRVADRVGVQATVEGWDWG